MKVRIIPEGTNVKNAVLLKDDEGTISLVHYKHEVLTVRNGQVVYMYPVSDSTDRAIMQALDYLGIDLRIDDYCKSHNVDRTALRKYFKNSGHKKTSIQSPRLNKKALYAQASEIAKTQ